MGPILFMTLPILAGALAYLLRRWPAVPPLLSTGVSLGLGLMLVLVPLDRPVSLLGKEVVLGRGLAVLGRTLVLGPSAQAGLAFLFLSGAGLFLLAWQLESEGLFAPLGLALLGLLSGVLLIRPLVYAALLLQIAVALAVLPLQADPRSPARGGVQFLTFFTLALPGLLISHWLLDTYAVTPDQTGLLSTATGLIGFSFALMLGVVPFHPWVPAVGRDGSPLMVSFLFSAISGSVWFLFLDYLRTYPWLSGYPQWFSVLTACGVGTGLMGGLLGMARRGPGALLGHAVLVDTGLLLVALGESTHLGVNLSMAMVFARVWGVALMGAGLAGLRVRSGPVAQGVAGLGHLARWSTAALMVGGLSLAGFPPTLGFVSRWSVYRLLFRTQPLTALVLLLASAGLLVGLLRLLFELLSPKPTVLGQEEEEEPSISPLPGEPFPVVVLLILLITATISLGLFPQGLMAIATRAGGWFTLVGP